jgi:endonuclease/exonuclease/phosphatase family metal-dependent hydrolase
MAKVREPWQTRGKDFSRPGLFAETTTAYRLLFEYLKLSPSYELARKANAEGLTKEDQEKLPSDFDKVLKTYELLGDVQKVIYRKWWLTKGIQAYGHPYSKPRVHEITRTAIDTPTTLTDIQGKLTAYLTATREEEGFVPTALISVPLGRTRKEVLRQINKLLDEYSAYKQPVIKKPKLKITAQRIHGKALMKGIRLIWLKAANPKLEEWRLGVHAKVSDTYNSVFDPKGPRRVKDDREGIDRRIMTRLTSRALDRAEKIAENAARGKFPSQESVERIDFSYSSLALRIQSNNKWEKIEQQRLLTLKVAKTVK